MSGDPLRQLLLMHEVPRFSELSPAQRIGEACAWCSTVADGDMVDLGGALGWQPRGCPRCYAGHHDFVRTYLDWAAHRDDCDDCGLARCDSAEQLAVAHRGARTAARKPVSVRCADCKASVHLSRRRIAPRPWLGEHGLYLIYAHMGPCPVIRRRGGRVLRTHFAVVRRPGGRP